MIRLGITGHQVLPDAAARYIEDELIRGVAAVLTRDTVQGVSSLAAGADQLFADVVLRLGGSLHVVVPSANYTRTFTEPASEECFEAFLSRAESSEQLIYPQPTEQAFFAAGCRVVDLSDEMWAVWDGEPARGFGGTADVVRYAESRRRPVRVIWPAGVAR